MCKNAKIIPYIKHQYTIETSIFSNCNFRFMNCNLWWIVVKNYLPCDSASVSSITCLNSDIFATNFCTSFVMLITSSLSLCESSTILT